MKPAKVVYQHETFFYEKMVFSSNVIISLQSLKIEDGCNIFRLCEYVNKYKIFTFRAYYILVKYFSTKQRIEMTLLSVMIKF